MIAVDTNILARFYCDDPSDPEAVRQRPVAKRVMLESAALFVPLTVMLEFEWVMRGFYKLPPLEFCGAAEHLIGMAHVTVERWDMVVSALVEHRRGLDFADALHWASSAGCQALLTFDDKGFARQAHRLGLQPEVLKAR